MGNGWLLLSAHPVPGTVVSYCEPSKDKFMQISVSHHREMNLRLLGIMGLKSVDPRKRLWEVSAFWLLSSGRRESDFVYFEE